MTLYYTCIKERVHSLEISSMRLQIPTNPPPTILVPTLGLQIRTLSLVFSVSGSSPTGAGSSDDDDDVVVGDSSRFGITVPASSESEVGGDGDDEASFQDEGSARDFFMANLTSHKRPPLSPAPSSTTLSWTKGSR